MAGYTRNYTTAQVATDEVIVADHLNSEFTELNDAFDLTGGHTHDGSTSGDGGPISKLYSNAITIGTAADSDISITFNTNDNDGLLTWMEDEEHFKFSDDILMNSTERIYFSDTSQFIYGVSATVLALGATDEIDLTATEIEINATTIDLNGAVAMDGAITGATNITLSGELDAATLDISGNADIDGTLEADAYTVDGTALNEYIADTVGAMVGSNTESGITVAYQDGDNTLDFTVGTLNQDTTGTAAIATTVTITDNESTNEDNAIIFTAGGDVDGGNLGLESDGDLTYNPSTGLLTATSFAGQVTTGAQTNIASLFKTDIKIGEDDQTKIDFETADTINFYAGNEKQLILTDGALTPGSNAIVDLGTDALEFKDAYFDGTVEADAITIGGTAIGSIYGVVAGSSSIVTTGALDSGSITSGFGTIDTGSSAITTTGLISGGSLDIDNVLINGTTIGHTDDTDLITVANGLVTIAGEISTTTLDIGGTNITATAAELNYSDGVTSAIQTQLNTAATVGKAIAMAIVFG